MESDGVSGKVLERVANFLKDRKQRVVVAGTMSDWASVTSGVPHGTVLGPLLFIIYINDMPNTIQSLIYLYTQMTQNYVGKLSVKKMYLCYKMT